jgi:hypothetical protein
VSRGYEAGSYKGYGRKIQEAFAAIAREDADVEAVAEAIVRVVDLPFGKRPFRVHIDPTQDGAEVAFRGHRPRPDGDAPSRAAR